MSDPFPQIQTATGRIPGDPSTAGSDWLGDAQTRAKDMKALVYEKYGSPDVLELRDIAKPRPGEHDVLIRVYAASVNASDWERLRGKPPYARMVWPWRPKHRVLGSDVAGRVEAVGEGVESFRAGDEVFGDVLWHGAGAFGEYVCVPESAPLVPKPADLSFEQAAAIPQAAVIARQGIEGGRGVDPQDRVLINGAGGGAGTFAVQLARTAGAHVTAVDSGRKLQLLRSLGADRAIDYTQQDFTEDDLQYHLILDLAAHHSLSACKRRLVSGGRYLMVGGSAGALLQAVLLGPLITRTSSVMMGLLAVQTSKDELNRVVALVGRGAMLPVIDRIYTLAEAPEALRRLGEGRALGKLVITLVPATAR